MTTFNRDIRCGLFEMNINEAWIHYSAEEYYDDDEDYDFEQDIDKYIIRSVLLNCACSVEIAINNGKYNDIGEIIQDCITEYGELFKVGEVEGEE